MATLRLTLIGVSLVAGLLGAATAYAPHVGPALAGLTLTANAGWRAGPEGTHAPIARKGDVLTAAQLVELRDARIARVLVREFAFERWTGRLWFVGGASGLLAAALWGRWSAANDRRRAGPGTGGAPLGDVWRAADQLAAELGRLAAGHPTLADYRAALEGLQRTQLPAMLAGLSGGVGGVRGSAGMLELRAAVSGLERLVNRGWSAAADGAAEEARAATAAARTRAENLRARLGALAGETGGG